MKNLLILCSFFAFIASTAFAEPPQIPKNVKYEVQKISLPVCQDVLIVECIEPAAMSDVLCLQSDYILAPALATSIAVEYSQSIILQKQRTDNHLNYLGKIAISTFYNDSREGTVNQPTYVSKFFKERSLGLFA